MAPNASLLRDEFIGNYIERNVMEIECNVCDEYVDQHRLIEHLETCAKGSSVSYLLKMSVLHQSKFEDAQNVIQNRFIDFCEEKSILLPKGICYYCETPKHHNEGSCQSVSRVDYIKKIISKTSHDYFWHFNEAQGYLKKAQLEMLMLKQRIHLDNFYRNFQYQNEESACASEKCYHKTIDEEIRAVKLKNMEAIQKLEEKLDRKGAELYDIKKKEWDSRHEDMLKYLEARDRQEPVVKLEFV